MDKAVETDERIIGEIFAAVDRDPKLKLINAEIPASKSARVTLVRIRICGPAIAEHWTIQRYFGDLAATD